MGVTTVSLLTASLLLAGPQTPQRLVVATEVVCRSLPGPEGTPVASLGLGERIRVQQVRTLAPDGEEWLLGSGVRRSPCWVLASLTVPLDPARPRAALLTLAERILETREGRPFRDFVAAENALLEARAGSDPQPDPLLELRRLQLVDAAGSAADFATVRDDPLARSWVLAHDSLLSWFEPGGHWTVRPDTWWELHERFREAPEADLLAWTAAGEGPWQLCEGSMDCELTSPVDTYVRYLRLHPEGAHVQEALARLRRHLEYFQEYACTVDQGWDEVRPETLEYFREHLEEAVPREDGGLFELLDEVERRCREEAGA